MNNIYTFKSIKNYNNALPRLTYLLAFFLLDVSSAQAGIRYVKPTFTGSGNGSSWANASNSIASMIANSVSGDQIWIAAGTYTPPASLGMKNGVAIYGGFVGTETSLSQRNWVSYPTIISGSSNGHNIIFINDNLNSTAILYGFTIMGAVNTKTLYVRIVQVDKAGNQKMSKVINATVK